MKKLVVIICLVFMLLFVGNVFPEEQHILRITDVNSDFQTSLPDFSRFAKYWQWQDLRESSNFETYQDYYDFWDPNSDNSSGFEVQGKRFDFTGDYFVGLGDLMFLLEDWPMPSYAYQRGVIVFKETDVDFSGQTDTKDLAGFSDYWLWYDVRDPNNFETYDDYLDFWDPNNLDPNTLDFTGVYFDFNEDGHVDFGDLSFLSRDWLDVADNFPSNISVEFDEDPNYLDGAVGYEIQGFRDTTKEIYVLLNSKVIDIITVDEMNVSMGVLSHSMDSTKYANNDPNEMHELCFVGFDSFGSPEVSDSFDIGFNNLLSNNLPQDYYTASGYFISGTYAGSKSLSVTVSRNGSVVYSRILAASSVINAHIPKEVFSDNDWVLNYEISLSELDEPNAPAPLSAGLDSAGMFPASAGETIPPYKDWKKNVYEKFDKDAYDPNVIRRVLFLLPDKKVTKMRWDVISSEMEACQNRNLRTIVLFYKDVNHVNLDFVFDDIKRLNTVFYHGHANYYTVRADGEEIERTFFQCWRKKVVKWFPDFYVESRAFSYSDPAQASLPDDWDEKGFFLWPYNLGMRYVLADGCNTAVNDDLFSAFCRNDNRYINRSLCGWKKPIHIGTGIWDGLTFSDEGLVEMAETLGRNDHLGRALQNISRLSSAVRREFWGVDYIPGGEKDNFGTYLSQFGAFHEIYLAHGR